MKVEFSKFFNSGDKVAVALSGGADSMALLHLLKTNAEKLNITVKALNVEHGIRGECSISDSAFVKDYCDAHGIELLTYSVDSVKKAKDEKLSIEQSARALRYACFYDAIDSGKCNKIATAHHLSDNAESVLLNVFRGTGINGIIGIEQNYQNKIIRPLLSVSKYEIEQYVSENSIPFVTDQTNFSDAYTRNNLRLNIIPKIKEIFPEVEQSIFRLSNIAKIDQDYLEKESEKILSLSNKSAYISIPSHQAIFSRATINAFKHLGLEKDWEKIHVDDVFALTTKENGCMINLPKNVVAVKEYDKIALYVNDGNKDFSIPFSLGEKKINNAIINIEKLSSLDVDLKSGLFADYVKIPKTAVIRNKRDGDTFTKFGGGTKSLGDFLTDKKIPLMKRNTIPLLAFENDVLVIFGIAVSDKIKVDENTKEIIKFKIQ